MATEEVNKPPSLPPYPQMILNAIEALNDKNGSNKSTIAKYIKSTYGDVPAGHNKLLSHHLNEMKDNGELVFWKNNYTKPDPNAPPRRGRGRPPTPRPKDPLSLDTTLNSAMGRGRPPKDPEAPPKPPKVKVSSGNGKPRGRPRKMAKPTRGLSGSSTVEETMLGMPRGRPPKVKDTLSAGDSVGQ